MPDWTKRQRFPRYELQLPVLYRLTDTPQVKAGIGRMRNLSEGGACLELHERLAPSTRLALILRTDQGAIEAKAEVVWVQNQGPPEQGVLHGVCFTHLTPEHHQALLKLFPQRIPRQEGTRLAVDLPVVCRIKGALAPPLQGRVGNISRGGLLLLLPHALPVSTGLEVTLPAAEGPLLVEGTIAWVDPPEAQRLGEPIRHGLRFTPESWAKRLAIGLYLAALLRSPGAGT